MIFGSIQKEIEIAEKTQRNVKLKRPKKSRKDTELAPVIETLTSVI